MCNDDLHIGQLFALDECITEFTENNMVHTSRAYGHINMIYHLDKHIHHCGLT
jgi:hypothetical protein